MADPADLLRARLRGEVLIDEPLARHTSLKVGGSADLFVVPADLDDLRESLKAAAAAGLPHLVIGGGYNLLVKDGGFRGLVISLQNFTRLERQSGGRLAVGAGVKNSALVRYAAEQGLTGLEFLSGIPGTVGGALSMNAGAHGEAIMERLESMVTLADGEVRKRGRHELVFGYRFLRLDPGEVVAEATFLLQAGEQAEIEERMESLLAHRRNAQRVGYPNAGSFFKNPEGEQAWRLIDQAGLRGCRVGGAEVSESHANFLVNRGGATAKDFLELAQLIREKVRQGCGIVLEEEVRVVGEDCASVAEGKGYDKR